MARACREPRSARRRRRSGVRLDNSANVNSLPADTVHPLTRAAWRAWLAAHHTRTQGVWLVSFKKATGKLSVDYDAAVEEALCFGWIDSKPRKLDAERTMLWLAPRKPRSGWSAANKVRVERLLAQGLMAPAGLAKIAAARQDGSWSKLDAVDSLDVPADLAQALDAYLDARKHFDAFPRSVRRGILEWIVNAKQVATRARRVAETARLAQDNVRANQWTPRR